MLRIGAIAGRNFTAWAVAHERLQQVLGTEIGCHWYGWETGKMVMLSRFACCLVSLTPKVSLLQSSSTPATPSVRETLLWLWSVCLAAKLS